VQIDIFLKEKNEKEIIVDRKMLSLHLEFNKKERMDLVLETAELRTRGHAEEKQLYSVEEVFDRIDRKFIDYYGEYGRKIVNTRRKEWNQDDVLNLKIL
jgi:hypothetical protein